MKNPASLLTNTFKYSFSAITTLFLFLLLIIAGRFLGAEEFGKFSFALAFVFLFDPILDPGLYHLLIREIALNKQSTRKFLSHALTWKLLIAPLFFLLVYLIANLLQDSQDTISAVYLMAISLFLKSCKNPFRTALLAHEYFGLDTISLFIERFSLLFFSFWLLLAGHGLIALCWVFVFVRLFDLTIIGAIVIRKICSISLGFDFSFIKYLVVTAVPIGAFYITLNIYNYVDIVMLSVFRADSEVGWYSASYKIYEGLLVIPVIVSTVFMPRLSQLYKFDRDKFTDLVKSGIKYILLLSLFVLVNVFTFAENIVTTLFGNNYIKSTLALQILLCGIIFVFILNFCQTTMIAMDRQRILFYFAVMGLMLNILLNLFIIPYFGFLGAAFTTIVVEGLLFISLLIYFDKAAHIQVCNVLFKPIIAALVPVVFCFFVLPDCSLLPIALVTNFGFFIMIYVTRVFDDVELATILDFFLFRLKRHSPS